MRLSDSFVVLCVLVQAGGVSGELDLYPAIRYLRVEAEKLDRAIASLEQLLANPALPVVAPVQKRRGRKSMGPEERAEVSKRMTRYWAKRRKASQ